MREQPPPQLIAMLEGLGLAAAAEAGRLGGRVRRLARDLPRFESVWVDAMAQARILTPFQAAELNAGRGRLLRIGPYVLCDRLAGPHYATCYRARRIDTRQLVRLAVFEKTGPGAAEILHRLESLAGAAEGLPSDHLAPVAHAGAEGDRLFAASRWVEGRTAAEWIVHNGRFPPETALEIARAMLAGLVALEEAGLCHGDVGAAGLLLTDAGDVVLPQPGVRPILRPEEGYAHADLLPEAYDYLAPERIADGAPPSTLADVYACGCVFWHLLCGRPPLAGGDSLAKLRSAQAGRIVDVRQLAPDTPAPLAAAISACLQREPSRRPESMARLAAALGSSTRNGRSALARCVVRSDRRPRLWIPAAATAAALMVAAATAWMLWPSGVSTTAANGAPQAQPGQSSVVADSSERASAQVPASSPPEEQAVMAAAYRAELPSPAQPPADWQNLVLPAAGPLAVESLDLRPGQRVGGAPGQRPLVRVPRAGLVVGAEDVCFEGIDFIWDHPADGRAAILEVRVGRADFRGCTFRAAGAGAGFTTGIRWSHAAEPEPALALPNGRLRMADCAFEGVGVGVDCRRTGAVALEADNLLHLGGGPLVRLDRCPRADEPVRIALRQVTLREAGPLLECVFEQIEQPPGEISIQAAGCAFAPAFPSTLLLFTGPDPPERLLAALQWTGQGSLVTLSTSIAAWRRPNGATQSLDDAAASIDGLVRGTIGFAGAASGGPAASRILRWQAPLRSADPPGADPARLPPGGR